MELLFIFWLLCGVVCYFIMKSKGYPNNTCLAHGVGGALLGVFWIIFVLVKKNYDEVTSSSQLSDMELLSKMMDLKERGAITESEFEEKKREILNSVKKNNKSVISFHTLYRITTCLFFIVCVIYGLEWLMDCSFDAMMCEWAVIPGILSGVFESMLTVYTITFVIMTLMLLLKMDVRFLCVPISVESIYYFLACYSIFRAIARYGDFDASREWLAVYILCAISTIIILYLILTSKQYPTILYLTLGISRIIHILYCTWQCIDGGNMEFGLQSLEMLVIRRGFLSIAYIQLGIMVKHLANENKKSLN